MDLISELPMYQYCEKVIEIVSNSILKTESIENNLYLAYKALLLSNIVCDKEIDTLEAWLYDFKKLN